MTPGPLPLAVRRRPTWPDLPAEVRAAIEARIGTRVHAWSSRDAGYSPGFASVLATSDGSVFVKAVDAVHEVSAHMYREEARRHAVLPESVPAPRCRWVLEVRLHDGGQWVALGFDAVQGATPRQPWDDAELAAVAGLAGRIAEHELPAGSLPEAAQEIASMDRWAALAAERPVGLSTYDPWVGANLDTLAALCAPVAEAVSGPHLVHGDLRGDNALLVLDRGAVPALRALAVDWPFAARGAAFCDLVGMLPAVQVEGGPDPASMLAQHPLPAGTDDDAVTCYVGVLTGYFLHSSLQPPPPAIPHVRAFQRAQAEACIPWLRHRLRA